MKSQWKLLTEEQIYRLEPKELASYNRWLTEYRQRQEVEIAEKKTLLNKIVKEKEKKQKSVEQKNIIALRNFLLSK